MIAGNAIAAHPIAAPLLRRRGVTASSPKGGGGGVDLRARLLREDDEVLAVIMAYTLRERFSRH